MTLFRRALGAVLLATGLVACSPTPEEWRVSLEQGREILQARQALVFDIREPKEHATGVAEGAVLLPMSQLNQRVNEVPRDPNQPVLLICNTQNRSAKVVEALREAGWTNVRYVHGGMSDWAQRGWPMVRPPI